MEELDLTPGALDIVEALSIRRPPEANAEVDEDLLVRFAAGVVSAEEHELIVDGLTRSDGLRRRIVVLRRELAHPESANQTDVSVVANLIRKAIGGYQAVAGKVADFADPFTVSAIQAAGRRLAADLSGPRWAAVRSGVGESIEPWTMTVGPRGLDATVVADLSAGGDLTMEVRLPGDVPHLDLCLRDPVFGFFVLGRRVVHDGVCSFQFQHFAEFAGIERIEPSLFFLAESGSESKTDTGTLLADVLSGDPVWIRIVSAPTVTDGMLSVAIALPPGLRQRMSNCDLELQLAVGSLTVPLASIRVADLPDDDVRFTVEVGQVADGVVGAGSVFRLRFVAAK